MKVLRHNGIDVVVPDQVCCGLPMVSKGNIKGANSNMEKNGQELYRLLKEGYVTVATCSSCSLFLKHDYPRLLGTEEARLVSQNLYHITEYLLKLHERGLLDTNFQTMNETIFYHTPCHMRAQEIGSPSVEVLKLIPGVKVVKASENCCGMGGAYGYEKKNYELSKEIAGKLYTEIAENPSDCISTDCGGCRLQIQTGTGRKVDHPIILIKEAYGL